MSAELLDGKAFAKELKEEARERATAFQNEHGVRPTLAAVLVGVDPASAVYVRNKRRACEQANLESRLFELDQDTSQTQLLDLISTLNEDADVHGILVQLPLPSAIDTRVVLDAVDPMKDVDAFHPENVGRLCQGRARFQPCTPYGIIRLLDRCGIKSAGRHVVVVGRSDIVGKPMAMMFAQKDSSCGPDYANATTTIVHSRSEGLADITRCADILVAAVGIPRFVTAEMIKPGAVVIDVGINRDESGLVGDVDFEPVAELASAITPVPGGVGPLTVAMLLHNTIDAAKHQLARSSVQS